MENNYIKRVIYKQDCSKGDCVYIDWHCFIDRILAEGLYRIMVEGNEKSGGFNAYIIDDPTEIYERFNDLGILNTDKESVQCENAEMKYTLTIDMDNEKKIISGNTFIIPVEVLVSKMIINSPDEFQKVAKRVVLGFEDEPEN